MGEFQRVQIGPEEAARITSRPASERIPGTSSINPAADIGNAVVSTDGRYQRVEIIDGKMVSHSSSGATRVQVSVDDPNMVDLGGGLTTTKENAIKLGLIDRF